MIQFDSYFSNGLKPPTTGRDWTWWVWLNLSKLPRTARGVALPRGAPTALGRGKESVAWGWWQWWHGCSETMEKLAGGMGWQAKLLRGNNIFLAHEQSLWCFQLANWDPKEARMNGSWGEHPKELQSFRQFVSWVFHVVWRVAWGWKWGNKSGLLFLVFFSFDWFHSMTKSFYVLVMCSTKDVYCSSCFDHICISIHMYMSKHASYDAKKTCKKEVMPDRQPMM